ncbi:MAG: hypothetical protein IKG87_00950 [Clostridia bacterium]|nr:hypothetical protein [Clostridia bacterium]MBR4576292.1 hypothetical protein [Clostridia bacterium]
MKKAALKIISLMITISIVLSLIPAAYAAVDPIVITITMNKEEVNINEEIVATYSVTGGNNSKYRIIYSWEEKSAGSIIYGDHFLAETSSGSLPYAPTKGEEVRLYMSVEDSDGRSASKFSEWIPVSGTQKVDPIKISVTLNKEEVNINEEIVATYSVTGGNNSKYRIIYSWEEKSAGSIIYGDHFLAETSSGNLPYTPTKGEEVRLYISVEDADGRSASKFSDWIPVNPQEIILNDLPSFIKTGETLQITPSINDGTKDSFTYSSSDNSILTVDENGKVTTAGGTGKAVITIKASKTGLTKNVTIAVIPVDLPELNVTLEGPTYYISMQRAILFTAAATGGIAPYKYTFKLLRDGNEVSSFETEETSASFSGYGINNPGIYTGVVIVEDAAGQTKSEKTSSFLEIGNGSSVLGDVNYDGIVDGRDSIRLMKYLSGENDETTGKPYEINKVRADYNQDGKIDELDLLRLMRRLGGETGLFD